MEDNIEQINTLLTDDIKATLNQLIHQEDLINRQGHSEKILYGEKEEKNHAGIFQKISEKINDLHLDENNLSLLLDEIFIYIEDFTQRIQGLEAWKGYAPNAENIKKELELRLETQNKTADVLVFKTQKIAQFK